MSAKSKKFFIILSLLCVFILLLTGVIFAGGKKEKEVEKPKKEKVEVPEKKVKSLEGVTIRVALTGGYAYEPGYAIIPQFEQETGAKVEIVMMIDPFEFDRQFKIDVASGQINYDVAYANSGWIPQYRGVYENLELYLDKQDLADYSDSMLELSKLDGELVIYPRIFDFRLFWYRKSLFENPDNKSMFKTKYGYNLAPPETWEQVMNMAEFFSDPPNIYGFQFPGNGEPFVGTFREILVSRGGEFFDEDWKVIFNNKIGVDTLEMLVRIYQKDLVPPGLTGYEWEDVARNFASGTIAMQLEWPDFYGWFANPEQSKIVGDFMVAYQPYSSPGKRVGWASMEGLALLKSSKIKKEAAEFIKYLGSPENQWVDVKGGFMPVRRSNWKRIIEESKKDPSLPPPEYWEKFSGYSETAYLFTSPKMAEWRAVIDIMLPYLQKALLGELSSKQALDMAAEEVKDLLTEKGYY